MMHAAAAPIPEPNPMRDASSTAFVWASGSLGAYLLTLGQAIQVALGVFALLVSILCGLITIQRFLWDREDRARRLGPPAPTPPPPPAPPA